MIGTESPITNADIAAFRVNHALDSYTETDRFTLAPGTVIVQEQIVFEVFSFHAEEVGDIIFDVRGIKDALADRKLVFKMFDTPLNKSWVEHIRKQGGVEIERMRTLTAADLERPPIAIFWPHNGFSTLIDGNNRLVRRWDDGLRTVRLAVIPLGKECLPYMCRPGGEEKFLERRDNDDPRGMTPLGYGRRGMVGVDCDKDGNPIKP